MSSQPICPCCHSPQATQRVTAIVTGGTQQVRVITADLMPAAGVSRTNLAQMLAPPRQPGGGWLIIVLLLGLLLLSLPASCMVTAVIVGLQGQAFEAAFTSGTAERLFAAVVGVAALASIAITVGIAQLGERRRRRRRAMESTDGPLAAILVLPPLPRCLRRWVIAGCGPRTVWADSCGLR